MREPLLLILVAASACYAVPAPHDSGRLVDVPERRLPAAAGWEAHALLPIDAALTRVAAFDLLETHGSQEVMALDKRGRCWVLASEGGRWSGWQAIHDRRPLTALARGHVDPRAEGPEAFVGGHAGNLYLVGIHPHGAVDARLIANFPGEEIHCALAADLDPFAAGEELLVFTHPAGAWRVHPTGEHGSYAVESIEGFDPAVRHALCLPFEVGKLPLFATASRSGRIALASLTPDGPELETLFQGSSGAAHLALAPDVSSVAGARRGLVLYSSLDDGRVLRHQRGQDGFWITKTIHLAPRSPRGLVAGTFDPDPTVETLAILGEAGEVELLTSRAGEWESAPLFADLAGGTWLARCELDGRNATDEILACGLDGSIVLLARSPEL